MTSPLAATEAARPIEVGAVIHVEVTAWRPFSGNTVAGFVDLRLPDAGLVILGAVLHQHCGQRWISLPATRELENGAVRYRGVIRFADDAARDAFQLSALQAVEAYLPKGGIAAGGRR